MSNRRGLYEWAMSESEDLLISAFAATIVIVMCIWLSFTDNPIALLFAVIFTAIAAINAMRWWRSQADSLPCNEAA